MSFRPSRRSPERTSVEASSPLSATPPSLQTRKTVMVDVGDGQPKSTSGKKKTAAVEAKSSSVGAQTGMFPLLQPLISTVLCCRKI